MIHTEGASLSPGTYVAIAFGVIFAVALTVGLALIITSPSRGGYMNEKRFGGVLISILATFFAGVAALAMYPLSADFHTYYRVTGNVTEVDSRLIGNGDSGVSQRFVVRLAPSGELFGIDDTRAATLKAGSAVDLRCKREFEFNSVPGWGCKWNAR